MLCCVIGVANCDPDPGVAVGPGLQLVMLPVVTQEFNYGVF